MKMSKRTLDDFPMEHGVADAVGLLERRRHEDLSYQRNMAIARCESKVLSSYSRRRFDAALSARSGQSAPALDVGSPLCYQEKSWQRPRLSVASYAGRDVKPQVTLSARPESEPPLRSWAGKTFDHTRGRPEAYPVIRQLVKGYNSGMKVVCKENKNCIEAWESRRTPSDLLLLPLQEPEIEAEEIVVSRLSLQDDTGDAAEDDAATDRSSAVKTPTNQVQDEHQKTPIATPIAPTKASTRQTTISSPGDFTRSPRVNGDEDVASSTHSPGPAPSPPWRCWVDDATVSSVNVVGTEEPAPPMGCLSPTPAVESSQTPLPPAETPATPPPTGSFNKKKHSVARIKKVKREDSDPVELHPVSRPVEEMKEEVVEIVQEVEEVQPVLPGSICPSSDLKAHEAEVKLWLRKSSFSAARRSAPMFWS